MEHYIESTLQLVAAHPNWVGITIFLAAFGESLFLIGLFVPGTAVLAGSGVLVGLGVAHLEVLLICAFAGAVLGDLMSYWLGVHLREPVLQSLFAKRQAALISKGTALCSRFGAAAIFLGRFFGPFRAIVPFAAGALGMPAGRFMAANLSSALVWVIALLGPTALLANIIDRVEVGRRPLVASLVAAVALAIAVATVIGRRLSR